MFNILRCFTGAALILFHLKAAIEVKAACSGGTKHGQVYSDSYEKGYTSIPQDCDQSLQVLNVSKNHIKELNDNDLANYPQLIEFTMKENTEVVKMSANFFTPVAESLQRIDISSSCFSSPFAKLPANMKRVVANSIYKSCNKTVTLPALDHLEFLNEFQCRENNLDDLPTLHPKAQIQYIDLSKNPMRNLKYSDIAPYCVLSQLNLFGTDLGLLQYRNQCCALKKWGEKSKMSLYLECNSESPCPGVEFDAKSISSYEECVSSPGASFLSTDYYMMQIVIVIAVLLAFSYLAFRYYKSNAMKRYQENERLRMAQLEHEEENDALDD